MLSATKVLETGYVVCVGTRPGVIKMTDLTNVPAPAFFTRWLVYALLIAGLITAWFMAMTVNPHGTSRITTVAVFLAPLSILWIIATVRRHRSRLAIVPLNVIVMALVFPFLLALAYRADAFTGVVLFSLVLMAVPFWLGAIVWWCTGNVEPKVNMERLARELNV